MIKITALNETSTNENEDEYANVLTKEAQEQIALNEYNRALELLVDNKKEEALNVLQELLNTELLDEVEKPPIQDGRSRPMLSLKYSCFKNAASIQSELKNYHDAIYNYCEAINLDDTDVTLWYKIGIMAVQTSSLEIACLAFKQGLIRNCNHWPCLDSIITVLYAMPDYMNCLLYISMALERDPSYIKGLIFREKIYKNVPSFEECYKVYNSSWMLDPLLDKDYDQSNGVLLIEEANRLNKHWSKKSKIELVKDSSSNLFLQQSLIEYSWLELGRTLVNIHKYVIENKLSFVSPISLILSELSNKSFSDITNEIYSTNFCKSKNTIVDMSYPANKEELVPNDLTFIKNNILVSEEHSSDKIDLLYSKESYKFYANKLKNFEENSIKTIIDSFHVKELDTINSNMFQEINEVNSTSIKKEDEILNKFKKENTNIKEAKELNQTNNLKTFENHRINQFCSKEKSQKVKKRRRSSLCFLTQWAWSNSSAKRSSRARTSGRKDYERDGIVLEETLKSIFPPTLLPDSTKFVKEETVKNDDSIDTMELPDLFTNKDADDTKSTESSKSASPANEEQIKYFGSQQENLDVYLFIKIHDDKSNIMVMIAKFIEFLCSKWNDEWPTDLSEIYLQSYVYMREHIPHVSPFIENVDDGVLNLDDEATLLFCELYVDKWLSTKPRILPMSSLNSLGIGISADELGYILLCKTNASLINEENLNFLLRLLWLKANIFLYQGDIEISLKTLELLDYHIHKFRSDISKPLLKLANCKYNSVISVKAVQKMLTSIERSKKFSKIKYLHQERRFEELSSILKDTFNFSRQTSHFFLCNDAPIERAEHLQLLLDSLWHLQQYEDCYVWAEACLHESWQNYLHIISSCANEEEKSKWTQSVLRSLEKLDACVKQASTFVVKYLPESRRSRLVQNLVQIVCHQLDVSDNTLIMPIESVSPWILLHSILQYEEDKQRVQVNVSSLKYKSYNLIQSEEEDENIPASIMILLKGHKFLGRHGWCCINEGKLLIFIMKLIIPKLYFPLYYSFKQKLKEPLEQIIYCLYGHPAKFSSGIRARPKYLDEHVKYHMTLTWEVCELLFEYYKPEKLPSFESKRIDSINSDTVMLFKKMCTLIPKDSDPTRVVEEMNAYLLGKKEKIPYVKKPLCNSISHIYYLIADYYFKAGSNQSWSSAVKYYILDLCLHPKELNSWAGLAMSTSTLMETWLNNFQPNINEEKYLSKARIAQRSYQHAIDLSPSHLTIWTEFGNFLYTVHSFCSRLLKQESDSLNMERFRTLENRKEEMLDKAKNCFASANHIYTACQGIDEPQDERWLYHYMLAKIAEKKNEDPPVFLNHYSKASKLLYENNAQYPKRISHKNPQNLAIEALEVYYRIHASILKYLEQHEGKPLKRSLAIVFERSLKSCIRSPYPPYDSVCTDILKKRNFIQMSLLKSSDNAKKNANIISISKQTFENKIIINSVKLDKRKRCSDDQTLISETKKAKLSSVSHLQLMQDVVALIDDLITKVCDQVDLKHLQSTEQHFESKSQNLNDISCSRAKTMQKEIWNHDLVNIQFTRQIELKQGRSRFSLDNDNILKSDSKRIHSEDTQSENFHKLPKIEEKSNCDKLEDTLSRRCSQESTTTTHTSTSGTNNTSSSSSTGSSSSEDSSDTSSESDSDSDSMDSDMEKNKNFGLNQVGNCELRWKKFQAAYTKEILLQEKESRSGAPASNRKSWPYFKRMHSFISPKEQLSRSCYSNVARKDTDENIKNRSTVNKSKRKNVNPIEPVLINVQNAINEVRALKTDTLLHPTPQIVEDNLELMIGNVIRIQFSKLSPKMAKKKRKLIMKCLIEEDSDSDI